MTTMATSQTFLGAGRAAVTTLTAACLLGIGTGSAQAADLDDWDTDAAQYYAGACARSETVITTTVTGTTDDWDGFDRVAMVARTGDLSETRFAEVPVGQTRVLHSFMTSMGEAGQPDPSTVAAVYDVLPDGSWRGMVSSGLGLTPQYGPCSLGVERIGGAGRAETAALLSAQKFLSADTVLVATSASYPDALSAGPLATQLGAPLLLTSPTSLPAVAAAELARLDPAQVIVIGGPSSVSDAVLEQIVAAVPGGSVSRLYGADRYGTSALIAGQIDQDASVEVYLASGQTFPDALVLSSLAAAQHAPLLLVKSDTIPAATAAALDAIPFTRLFAAGGTSTISDEVLTQAADGADVLRYSGANRYATSAAVLHNSRHPDLAAAHGRVVVATGERFPDSLTAVAAAHGDAPIALTRPAAVPPAVLTEIQRYVEFDTAPLITVVGGPTSVQDTVLLQLYALLDE